MEKEKKKKESQEDKVLKFLQSGREITSEIAFEEFGITQLPGRIFNLRRRGYPIHSELILKYGKGNYGKKFFLKDEIYVKPLRKKRKPKMNMPGICFQILDYLQHNKTVTNLEMNIKFNLINPANYISFLRKNGYKIKTTRGKNKIAIYSLEK